jgi:hypothetical protein
MFSPEFSQHWIADQERGLDAASSDSRDDDVLSPSQQEALEALVDRVNAARTIV